MSENASNILQKPLQTLFDRLVELNGFLNLLDNHLQNSRKLIRSSIDEKDLYISDLFAGSRLFIRDLTVPAGQDSWNLVSAGLFKRTGDGFLSVADELVNQGSHWSVLQCYEMLETYLRDIAAHYYFFTRPEAPIGELKFVPIERDDLTAWQNMFRRRDRRVWNSFSLLNQLKISAPDLGKFEKNNRHKVNLREWHSLLATVRHSITHSNSRFKREHLKASGQAIKELLPKAFPGEWEQDEYVLKMDKKSSDAIIEMTGEYAFLIFKCLSMKEGWEWDMFDLYGDHT